MSKKLIKFDQELKKICKLALIEDKAQNDITSDLIVKKNSNIYFKIVARQEIILCGVNAVQICFDHLTKLKKFKNIFLGLQFSAKDGDKIKAGEAIVKGFGDAKLIFAAERVILNLLQHLSGIATLTNQFVKILNNKKIKILDTRKTLPGLRALQKQAVLIGGGKNHRFNLSDMILIKDNHIAAAKDITKAILAAKKSKKLKIEIECDNFDQVVKAVNSKPDVIMLDNMNPKQIEKCTKLIRSTSKEILIEISGGINLKNIKNFRNLDIDFISIGSLTHSAAAVDIGLDIN
ncbi:MAG: carboxylating nicotinate-nucleotide diphosphorylase [Rickettsiales bacterium]|nr:carboxylating nicotinate-nucleotide diphosphorylase [Rickettsiales bacterium]